MENARTSLLLTAVTILAVGGHVWQFTHGHSDVLLLLSFGACCLLVSTRIPLAAQHDCATAAATRFPLVSALRTRFASGSVERPRNAITIDLEDYFHTEVASRSIDFAQWENMPPRVERSTHRLLDMLDEQGTAATFFILGWVAERHPALVREVARRGHEIACHSYRHRLVYELDQAEFRRDTLLAKQLIEDVTGTRVRGYRAPSFSITPGTEWAFDTLAELGFDYDSSVNPVWHRVYGHHAAPRHPYRHAGSGLLELPIASVSVAGLHLPTGGGAYLRLLPYWYLRAGLAAINQIERKPATLYVHPWEIDSYCPLIPQDWPSRVRQTWGTATMEKKLSGLLGSAAFGPICQVYAECLSQESHSESPTANVAPDNVLAGAR